MKTHLTETTLEEHNDQTYVVKKRSPEETARLERLVEQLDPSRTYKYSTGTPLLQRMFRDGKEFYVPAEPRPLVFHVTATSMVEATQAGRVHAFRNL